MPKVIYDHSLKQQALELLEKGDSIKDIATKLNLNYKTVYTWNYELKHSPRKTNSLRISALTANDLPCIPNCNDHMESLKILHVVEFLGFDSASARQFCREKGVKLQDVKDFLKKSNSCIEFINNLSDDTKKFNATINSFNQEVSALQKSLVCAERKVGQLVLKQDQLKKACAVLGSD